MSYAQCIVHKNTGFRMDHIFLVTDRKRELQAMTLEYGKESLLQIYFMYSSSSDLTQRVFHKDQYILFNPGCS